MLADAASKRISDADVGHRDRIFPAPANCNTLGEVPVGASQRLLYHYAGQPEDKLREFDEQYQPHRYQPDEWDHPPNYVAAA